MWRDHPVTLEEAEQILRDISFERGREQVLLEDALGRVCAEPVYARENLPPFARSPLDGYAVRSIDTRCASLEKPVSLQVISCIFAGMDIKCSLGEGEAVRIMTGAPIPEGADAVIMQEEVSEKEGKLRLSRSLQKWENYCFPGERICRGKRLLEQGQIIRAAQIRGLAGQGITAVSVYRIPAVGVMASGDELMEPGEKAQRGMIYDENSFWLGARVRELGMKSIRLKPVPDQLEALTEGICQGLKSCDLLITTGGVSVGLRDLFPQAARMLGATVLFHGIQMKPGSPSMALLVCGKPVFCLSGNPPAAAVGFELLVRPVLERFRGREEWRWKREEGRMAEAFSKQSATRRFLEGWAENGTVWLVDGDRMNGNCLIDIPKGNEGLRSGDPVSVWMMQQDITFQGGS